MKLQKHIVWPRAWYAVVPSTEFTFRGRIVDYFTALDWRQCGAASTQQVQELFK